MSPADSTATTPQHAPAKPDATRFLSFEPRFHSGEVSPHAAVAWETFDAEISEMKDGVKKVVFKQDKVMFPAGFSQLAVNVVASKYFYGPDGDGNDPAKGGRENSLWQLSHRVCGAIRACGVRDGYLQGDRQGSVAFGNDLLHLVLNQYGAFNSPVWFNVGLWHAYGIEGDTDGYFWDRSGDDNARVRPVPPGQAYAYPQASACFIQSVKDNMESIANRAVREMMLFKHGSGTGTDNSTIRSSKEFLGGGGRPSGPVSFMEIYDAVAGVTHSGGRTRRAAKLESLKVRHPDILEFIQAKSKEEKKAHDLIEQGWPAHFNKGGAYGEVKFQNSNMSVRASDEFMEAAAAGRAWQTTAVTTGTSFNTHGEAMPKYEAARLLDAAAEGAWFCGDPGLQYEDTIQRWHTCPNTAPINASNPCSEYMFIDDSACNLASLNLMKFRTAGGGFDVEAFKAACRLFIVAQDILVDAASYPSAEIAANSHRFRPLGLGYCNLGALLMSLGLPYDSPEGRALCSVITAIMTGQAYLTSAEVASVVGPFEGFEENRGPMLDVMHKHRDALADVDPAALGVHAHLLDEAWSLWRHVVVQGEKHGFRNSQVTVLAPTGTIAFMMDADTTGIEPDIALVKYKKLAGGGQLRIVNQTVPMALEALGYGEGAVESIAAYIEAHDTIEGAPDLLEDSLPVFDCAFPPPQGGRTIAWRGHIKMMAAAQPWLSGAISKTINMDSTATAADIRQAYVLGWQLGLKAVAVYRNGCKKSQPLNTKSGDDPAEVIPNLVAELVAGITAERDAALAKLAEAEGRIKGLSGPYRRKLPKTRPSVTHHFSINNHEGYFTLGFYPDTMLPGELFITMSKEGSTIGGLMDTIGTLTSFLLQYGAPLGALVEKFAHTRFEPSGITGDANVRFAKSIVDYVFRWIGMEYVEGYREAHEHDSYAEPKPEANGTPAGGRLALSTTLAAPKPTNGHHNGTNGATGLPAAATAVLDAPRTQKDQIARFQSDAPACDGCGAITVRCGSCYRCFQCGTSMGCS